MDSCVLNVAGSLVTGPHDSSHYLDLFAQFDREGKLFVARGTGILIRVAREHILGVLKALVSTYKSFITRGRCAEVTFFCEISPPTKKKFQENPGDEKSRDFREIPKIPRMEKSPQKIIKKSIPKNPGIFHLGFLWEKISGFGIWDAGKIPSQSHLWRFGSRDRALICPGRKVKFDPPFQPLIF